MNYNNKRTMKQTYKNVIAPCASPRNRKSSHYPRHFSSTVGTQDITQISPRLTSKNSCNFVSRLLNTLNDPNNILINDE